MILRLLIVEDEKQICDAIAKSLYDAGYEVDTCYDGEDLSVVFYARLAGFRIYFIKSLEKNFPQPG